MAVSLKEALRTDLDRARRERDRARTLVLSTALADVRNREIEVGGDLDDAGVEAVLARAVKQRRDAASQMAAAGRADLAERETFQADLLAEYLGGPLTEDDVRAIVRDVVAGGARGVGAVMARLMPRIQGRFDGRAASRIAREEL